jgi:hypothetical protein
MERCPYLEKCAFYLETMNRMPLGSEYLKRVYCHFAFARCRRLKHAGEEPVGNPANELTPLGRFNS